MSSRITSHGRSRVNPLDAITSVSTLRLGRVEIAILDVLSRHGGLTPRDEALEEAFPRARATSNGDGTQAAVQDRLRRARAEAALSRAILSLERKGLIVRERNARTGRTLLRSADRPELPEWEEMARAEEDLAAHCRRVASSWRTLARRAQQRADAVRTERSSEATEAERQTDLEEMVRLQRER